MDKRYIVGIDVGGTNVKYGLFLRDGNLLEKWEVATDIPRPDEIFNYIVKSLVSKLADRGVRVEELLGIGIGMPGPVREFREVNGCVNLGLGVVDVASEMKEALNLDLPVYVENDANLAALGEANSGTGEGYESVYVLTLGTGVGGGFVSEGKIVSGKHMVAGEVGHIIVNPNGETKCTCGNSGCLETYGSATGIVNMAKGKMGVTTAKEIFELAKNSDTTALEVVEEYANYLGIALSTIACVVDPEVFIIGGGVSNAGDFLIHKIKAYYKKYAFSDSKFKDIKCASLKNDAGIIGCFNLVLNFL